MRRLFLRRSTQITLLVVALVGYFWFPVWTAFHHLNNNDFKHIYLGMKALLDGISPYSFNALHHQAALQGYHRISLNPYVYLPFTGHAMAFLAPLRLEAAAVTWFVCNHVFLGFALWIISSLWPSWRVGAFALLIAAMAGDFPLFRTLTAGQLNLALLLLICLGWKFQRAGRPVSAGGTMAFAALFKLMPGIFFFYFLLDRRWRSAASMAVVGSGLLLLSTTLAGWATTMDFLPELRQMGYGKSTWPHVFSFWDDPANQSLNSFFSHILAKNDHTTPWFHAGQIAANRGTAVVTLLLMGGYLATALRRKSVVPKWAAARKVSGVSSADCLWCATLILGLLIPSLMWDHYLVMLILPVAVLIKVALERRRWVAGAATGFCWIVTAIPWNFESASWRSGMGILLMSLKLWPTLLLFGLSLCCIRWQTVAENGPDNGQPISSLADQSRWEKL